MKSDLNILERAIITEIVNFNEKKYPFLKDHLPYLKVNSRKYTGIGLYVNFEYLNTYKLLESLNQKDIVLSSDKQLELNTLKYSLNYELNITNGRFDFLELVTNGESWKGDYNTFKFVDV